MTEYTSTEHVLRYILTLWGRSYSGIVTILVGGCSRTGKTVFVSKVMKTFMTLGIHVAVMNLDAWLVSVDKRRNDSTVLERYEVDSIISSFNNLQQGKRIYPPVYDVVSRRRAAETGVDSIIITQGILIVEGVIALAIEDLVKNAALRIYTEVPDALRRERLVEFYSRVKGLNRNDCQYIIESREEEEVPFIKETAVNADIRLIESESDVQSV